MVLMEPRLGLPPGSDPVKKAQQMQSWYLYEQYKSLECNQLYPAKDVKDRSSQERILHQELRERRARRRICGDQYGTCHSESRLARCVSSDTRTLASASADDFIDSICDFNTSEATIVNSEHTYDLPFDRYGDNDGKTVSYGGDIYSDEKEVDSNPGTRDDLELLGNNATEKVNLLVEPMLLMEPIIGEKTKELSMAPLKRPKLYKTFERRNGFPAIWSTLVTFAYELLRLNHGNCYYEYSSQVMTAVLACDFICKGLHKMCDILQPYVTPVKFDTDEPDGITHNCEKTDRWQINTKFIKKYNKNKSQMPKLPSIRRHDRKYLRSKQRCIKSILENETNKRKLCAARSSTNFNSLSSKTYIKKLEDYHWKRQYCNRCSCHCTNYIGNPMIKLCQYIDSIIKDLDEC